MPPFNFYSSFNLNAFIIGKCIVPFKQIWLVTDIIYPLAIE